MPLDTTLELPVFQGPLDLLLSLIERRKLEITTVSLVAVTDQYLTAVRAMPAPSPDVLGEFLLIASRLLLLKSRALLPRDDDTAASSEDDDADELLQRLEVYQEIKRAAERIGLRLEANLESYVHAPRQAAAELQPELEEVDPAVLALLWTAIVRRLPVAPRPANPLTPRVSVESRLDLIRDQLRQRQQLDWEELALDTLDEAIATFLALLELIRRQEVRVTQDRLFGKIVIAAVAAT